MTRGELRELVCEYLDDPLQTYFTPTQVNTWLNLGLIETQKKLIQSGELFWAVMVGTNTITNVESYTLPTDYMRLHRLDLIVSGQYPNQTKHRLRPMTPVQADSISNGNGCPHWYWLKKDCLVLVKPPNQTYQMEMLYSPQVAPMTLDSQTPDCPDRYQEFIALHAVKRGFLKDQRNPNPIFNEAWADFEKMLEEDSQNRTVDEPREVVVTEDTDFYYSY